MIEYVPPMAPLSVEAAKFVRETFATIDAATNNALLGLVASQTARAAHAHLVDLGVADPFPGPWDIPSLDVLNRPELRALQTTVAAAADLAEGLDLGADGDAEQWLSDLLGAISRTLDLREQNIAVVDAHDAMHAADVQARARATRPPSDLRGIPPWSQVSGGADDQ